MSSRLTIGIALLLSALVIGRAFPFVWWPAAHFDSDQAIVGLMARHISEGRAFPLYFYGQPYMLAVEAYLAAPVMALIGPTVTALKVPLVAINIAAVLVLWRALIRDAALAPAWAAVAVLPLALPAAGVAARVTEANGGNVEPWLYVALIWTLRHRPWALGVVVGIGTLHREFTLYGVAALAALDLATLAAGPDRLTRARALARRWTVTGLAALAVFSAAATAQPFASALGPGTAGDDPMLLSMSGDPTGRLCLAPERWPDRARTLWFDHLPRLVGGAPDPLREYGVLTGVYSGQAGLGPWVLAIVVFGLAAGAWYGWQVRRGLAPAPAAHIGAYLVLVGLGSTLVYGFATCSEIRVATMRYNLLGVLIPVGALTMALQAGSAVAVRAGLAAAVTLWCVVNTLDVAALAREYARHPLPDERQAVADALERRGITVARSSFRNAYHLTFITAERVRVTATDFVRIRAYAEEAASVGAPTLAEAPCGDGPHLGGTLYLCR